jgi:multiple sugar transport system permease protein
VKRRALSTEQLGWLLCTPALLGMLLVAAYPVLYAIWLSLFQYDLRFPDRRAFVGWDNYLSVLGSAVWWQALGNTLLITLSSLLLELLLGLLLALLMHRALFLRRTLRAAVLVPYAIITVVAALAWKFAFDPVSGFVNPLFGVDQAWLSERWSAFLVIVLSEVWKTTPFVALLLLAGLAQVPHDLLDAARVDGAGPLQRFWHITLPMIRPAILVALLFRTLDALRIFDMVFVQTRGAQGTETLSIVAYHALITRLNLGLGSTVSVLLFLCIAAIAFVFVTGLGAPLVQRERVDH